MMYNRYIPESNGVYKKHCIVVPEPDVIPDPNKKSCAQEKSAAPCEAHGNKTPSNFDLGDILLLCIVILILFDSEEDDILPILIAAAAFVFLQ